MLDIRTDEDAIRLFQEERARLEQNPLWRAAWLAARDQGQQLFWYDGVEWPV